MTLEEIKKAIENNSIVEFTWNKELWGTLTVLSDDETTVYYKRYGCGLFRYATTIDKVIKPRRKK